MHGQDVIRSFFFFFLAEFNGFEFKVFLLLDWLPYQG